MSYAPERNPRKTNYPLPKVQWANDEDNGCIYEPYREYLMAAAVIYDGECYAAKHHCICYRTIARFYPKFSGTLVEGSGFLTNLGRYVGRKEGLKIALARGQYSNEKAKTLFSEDLW